MVVSIIIVRFFKIIKFAILNVISSDFIAIGNMILFEETYTIVADMDFNREVNFYDLLLLSDLNENNPLHYPTCD